MVGEEGADGVVEEVEHALPAPSAGGQGGPEAFQPLAPRQAAAALGRAAVDGDEVNRLFRQTMRGLDARRGDEPQVGALAWPPTKRSPQGRRCAPWLLTDAS